MKTPSNPTNQTVSWSLSTDLRRSGLLHGTNFEEWKQRMQSILRIHGLDTAFLEDAQQNHHTASNSNTSSSNHFLAETIISMLVHPDMISRVPASERSNSRLLVERLKEMSTHFRFLDLPAELRIRIYSFVLTTHDRIVMRPSYKRTTKYPDITKTSHQIREEVLPIFYSSTTFELAFDNSTPSSGKGGTELDPQYREKSIESTARGVDQCANAWLRWLPH